MKPGDLVRKARGHSDLNRVGTVIESFTNSLGVKLVRVLVGLEVKCWKYCFVEVVNEVQSGRGHE